MSGGGSAQGRGPLVFFPPPRWVWWSHEPSEEGPGPGGGRGPAGACEPRDPLLWIPGVSSSPPWAPVNPPLRPTTLGDPLLWIWGESPLRTPEIPPPLPSLPPLPQMGLLADPGAGRSPGESGEGDAALEAELLQLLGARGAPEGKDPPPQQGKAPSPCLDPPKGDQLLPKQIYDPPCPPQLWQQSRPWPSSASRTPWRRRRRRMERKIWRTRRSCWWVRGGPQPGKRGGSLPRAGAD